MEVIVGNVGVDFDTGKEVVKTALQNLRKKSFFIIRVEKHFCTT